MFSRVVSTLTQTQPGHPSMDGCNEYQPIGGEALQLWSEGRYDRVLYRPYLVTIQTRALARLSSVFSPLFNLSLVTAFVSFSRNFILILIKKLGIFHSD